MRGSGQKKILAENLFAFEGKRNFGGWVSRQLKLCWKCQKDKPQNEGFTKVMDGFQGSIRKFICKDCLEAKAKEKEV